jgi:hypothetical protein
MWVDKSALLQLFIETLSPSIPQVSAMGAILHARILRPHGLLRRESRGTISLPPPILRSNISKWGDGLGAGMIPTGSSMLSCAEKDGGIVMAQLNGKVLGNGGELLEVNLSASESVSGVQKIIRPHTPSPPEVRGDVVYRCIAVASASDAPGALFDDISKILVTAPGYVASWFCEWGPLIGRPTAGAIQDELGRQRPVPLAYKEVVHQTLTSRIANREEAQTVDFEAPFLDDLRDPGGRTRSKGPSRCVFLPIKVRDRVVSGLLVCVDRIELLDSSSIARLKEVAEHVAQRLGELEILTHQPRGSGALIAEQPPGFSPSQRPTIRVEEEPVRFLNATIPVSVVDKIRSRAPDDFSAQHPALEQARSLVHSLSNQLSVILTYTDPTLLTAPPPPELAEDLEVVRKAGEKAADLVRQLHKVFEE